MDEIRAAADMAETRPGSGILEFGELPFRVLAEWAMNTDDMRGFDVESVKHMFERWWRVEKTISVPLDGGYCGACGRTMHTQTRVLVAHEPEADHIYCMWCGVRLTIAPDTTPCAKKKEALNSERYYVPCRPEKDGTVRLDWAEKKTNQADCDEINPGWHWLYIEATTEDGDGVLRQIKEATNE
jgi:hypothetical protein